jgi:hypothetical protein
MLLDGKLQEYQRAFQAVDTSGNGTLGVTLTAGRLQTASHSFRTVPQVEARKCMEPCADGGT